MKITLLVEPTFQPFNEGCFPGEAEVEVEGKGASVRMSELQYGDKVKAMETGGKVKFAEVYMFTHRENVTWSKFVTLHTKNSVLRLTAKHYALVCVSACDESGLLSGQFKMKSVYAKDVNIGDILLEEVNGCYL